MHGNLEMASRRKYPQPEIRTELLHAVREILRNAIMTQAALRDPDRRYLGWSQMPTYVVNSIYEAYGYSSASVRAFRPSPAEIQQMEKVSPWLAWMRRAHGDTAIRRFIAWSMGVPAWRLAQREGCGERTLMYRMNRSVASVIREFTGADLPVEEVDEPVNGVSYAVIFEKPDATSNGVVKPMKIYIGGRGMWRNGKWLRDGQHRAEKFAT